MPVTLRIDAYQEALARRDWTDTHFAAEAGLHQLTVERATEGASIGGKFIAGALQALPEMNFDDLFTVTPGPDAREPELAATGGAK